MLNRGLVIAGEITIAVADIDLIFVGLNVLVSSVETAHEVLRKRQTRMKLYVYCLAEGVIDMLDDPVRGISGAPVRLLKIDRLSVLVSDLDADAVPVTRENALAHAAVVRSVLDRTTPLPFRFGTLVTEQQLTSYFVALASRHSKRNSRTCAAASR